MTGSLTLCRIRADLRRERARWNIARIAGDADEAGAIELEIGRLETGERKALALLRGRIPHPYRPRGYRRRRA